MYFPVLVNIFFLDRFEISLINLKKKKKKIPLTDFEKSRFHPALGKGTTTGYPICFTNLLVKHVTPLEYLGQHIVLSL